MRVRRQSAVWLPCALLLAGAAQATHNKPILFVTQVPIGWDADAALAVFDNHHADPRTVGRGGDLYLLPANSTTPVNLTRAAGFGLGDGPQGSLSIAVRDPVVSPDAAKVLFSMVVGAPDVWNQAGTYRWQLYELSNLAAVVANPPPVTTPIITLVANQPAANNVSPAYLTDGRILFTSDYPPGGAAHLAPQSDEYRGAATVSGLWSMDRAVAGGDLRLLDASPSGDFTPIVDSFGRIIMTRWDHLQRDARADGDHNGTNNPLLGVFNWSSEAATSTPLADITEHFPAPQSGRPDLLQTGETAFEFNVFFPWMMNQDGTGMETINHIGRHELAFGIGPSFNNDGNLVGLSCTTPGPCPRFNKYYIRQALELRELPTVAGTYVGVDGPETGSLGGGQIFTLPAPPSANPDSIQITWVTSDKTKLVPGGAPPPCHTGYYRNPVGLSDGSIIASHNGTNAGAPITVAATNNGGTPNYKWRLVDLTADLSVGCTSFQKFGANLTTGVTRTVSYFDGTSPTPVTFSGTMWEIQPVEVASRAQPASAEPALPNEEASAFLLAGVDQASFREYLRNHDLALIASRNVTTRDGNDKQQPFQLQVDQPGGVQTPSPATGTVYLVKYFQLFQGDLLRGIGLGTPGGLVPGRRVLAQPMHDGGQHPPPSDGSAPAGAVELAADGSYAAMVPAHRAMSWQLVDDAGAPKVRERFWLTFGKGEIRVCASCHGINTHDQTGANPPTGSPPVALQQLLTYWKTYAPLHVDDFESASLGAWTSHTP